MASEALLNPLAPITYYPAYALLQRLKNRATSGVDHDRFPGIFLSTIFFLSMISTHALARRILKSLSFGYRTTYQHVVLFELLATLYPQSMT